jgi:hypothetical protein
MGRAPSVISSPAINEQIPLQGKYKIKKKRWPRLATTSFIGFPSLITSLGKGSQGEFSYPADGKPF